MQLNGIVKENEDYLVGNRVVVTFKNKEEDKDELNELLKKANQKSIGVTVKAEDLFLFAFKLITDKHIEKLQKESITPQIRQKMAYQEALSSNNFKGSFVDFLSENSRL